MQAQKINNSACKSNASESNNLIEEDNKANDECWTTIHDHYPSSTSNCNLSSEKPKTLTHQSICKELNNLKNEVVSLKDEISDLKDLCNQLIHEFGMFKTLNHDLRCEVSELNEREKNRYIRSGIPFRFTPHSSGNSLF